MFNNSKYTKIYFQIIEKSRSKIYLLYEKHHIIPKSLGGINDASNIIKLSPKEHYICHLLLCKMCTSTYHHNKMLFAFNAMTNGLGHQVREGRKRTGKIYENLKADLRLVRSERMKGSKNPSKRPEVKEKLRALVLGDLNHAKRPEVRMKMRKPKSVKTFGRPVSAATRQKTSESLKRRRGGV